MTITISRSHAVLFASGFALALLLSAAPVKSLFGSGVPNSFVAGEVASADEVNANFAFVDNQINRLAARIGTSKETVSFTIDSTSWEIIHEFTFNSPNPGTAQIFLSTLFDGNTEDRTYRLSINGIPETWEEGDHFDVLDEGGDHLAKMHNLSIRELSTGVNFIRLEARMEDPPSKWNPAFTILESNISILLLED